MQHLLGKVVEPTLFSDNEMEWVLNSGMRMRVIDVQWFDLNCWRIDVDLTEFVEYNKPFLQHNFHDRDSVPCLNVYEAGYILSDNREILYIEEDTLDQMLKIVEI